jgi:hypothetical protein
MLVQNGSPSLRASGPQAFLKVGSYNTRREPIWLEHLVHAALCAGSLISPLAILDVGQAGLEEWWGAFEPAWI